MNIKKERGNNKSQDIKWLVTAMEKGRVGWEGRGHLGGYEPSQNMPLLPKMQVAPASQSVKEK